MTQGVTHDLNPGDKVRVIGRKTIAQVAELNPMQHWPNCVVLNRELSGYRTWDAHELEKVK